MIRWLKALLALFLISSFIGLLVLSMSIIQSNSGSWRYKMTVTVDTPEGIKSGSAVREVRVKRPAINMPQVTSQTWIIGEAVVVDLGKKGTLFAIISKDDSVSIVFRAFGWRSGGTSKEGIKYFKNLKSGKATLRRSEYPTFVTFRNLNDPKSILSVQLDDLASSFGEGVDLRDVTIEMTEEPVTTGIDRYLPWLSDYYDRRLDGERFGTIHAVNRMANSHSSGNFAARD